MNTDGKTGRLFWSDDRLCWIVKSPDSLLFIHSVIYLFRIKHIAMALLVFKHVNGKLYNQMIYILNNKKYGSDACIQSEVAYVSNGLHLTFFSVR